jgi:hypothetical protein
MLLATSCLVLNSSKAFNRSRYEVEAHEAARTWDKELRLWALHLKSFWGTSVDTSDIQKGGGKLGKQAGISSSFFSFSVH